MTMKLLSTNRQIYCTGHSSASELPRGKVVLAVLYKWTKHLRDSSLKSLRSLVEGKCSTNSSAEPENHENEKTNNLEFFSMFTGLLHVHRPLLHSSFFSMS